MKFFGIQLLCVLALITTALAGRRTCYECVFGDLQEANDLDCNTATPKNTSLKICSASRPHCLKIFGLVNGIETGKKMCAENNWAKTLKGKDKCVNTVDIENFGFSLNGKEMQLSGGLVCICNENNCNGQTQVLPSKVIGVFGTLLAIYTWVY